MRFLLLLLGALSSAVVGSTGPGAKLRTPLKVQLAQALIETAFSIKPLYKIVSAKAREGIVGQGAKMGVDWAQQVTLYERQREALEKHYSTLLNVKVEMPQYYLQPFHAYEEGNLSWQCAMEVGSAALTVHSNIFTPNRQTLEIEGDDKLRTGFIRCVQEALDQDGRVSVPPKSWTVGVQRGFRRSSSPRASHLHGKLSDWILASTC